MPRTKIKTQTVTNTQLGVAVLAAFMAGGLAFAAAPAQQAVPVAGACVLSEATITYTHAINNTRTLCPNNGYWGARFTCTDRKNDTVSVGNGPCVTEAEILAMARAKCASATHSCVPRNPVAVPQGTLEMSMNTEYANLKNDQYALAGTDRFLAGRIKLKALREEMNVRDLSIEFTTTSLVSSLSDLEKTIDAVSLYSSPNLNDVSLLGTADLSGSPVVTFQGINYTVVPAGDAYLYVGLRLNSVGVENDGTAVPSTSFYLKLPRTGQNVVGRMSGNNIPATVVNSQSNNITVLPVKIIDVSSNFQGGNLVGGTQNIFSFRVTADAGRNTDAMGDPLQAHLLQLGLQLSSDVGTNLTSNVSNLQLCRVDSQNCINLGMGEIPLSATNTTVTLVNAQTGTSTINLSAFPDANDEYVDSGETAEFIVRGNFNNVMDHFVQVKIVNLNHKGLTYGFDTSGDGQDDYIFTDIRKDAPRSIDYPRVVGMALVN